MAQIGVEIGDLLRPRRAGMARYANCLLAALTTPARAHEIQAWAPWRRATGWFRRPPNVELHLFGKVAPQYPPQVFHATACVFPGWRSRFEIATVHDLYAVREELHLSAPEIRRRADYIYRADRVICASHYTRAHLHALLNVPANRTTAIPLAAGARFVRATADEKRQLRRKHRLPQEFLLFLGRDRPNKNLDRLVLAYASSGLAMPLCIAGRQSNRTRRRLMQLAREHQCVGSLRWLGFVRETDLPVLLSCASALCMPSTFEGFGLPIVEAMACGTPVLTSAGRATEEAAGGKAVLVDPECIASLADGLLRVLSTTEEQRREAMRNATRRSWDDVAVETWQVYEGRCDHDSGPTRASASGPVGTVCSVTPVPAPEA